MFLDDPLNKTIRALIRQVMGLPANYVRPANSNAPSGAKSAPYATVFLSSTKLMGTDKRTYEDNVDVPTNLDEMMEGLYSVTASVQFFRGSAFATANNLIQCLQKDSAIEYMQVNNIGFAGGTPARDLSGVVDTYWEARAQVMLNFNIVLRNTETVATYGEFPIAVLSAEGNLSFEVNEP